MAALPELNTLSLCTGYGGLERGLHLAGIRTRLVAACERDPYAAAVLVARMEESALDSAPIWDSIESFPGEQFAGCVDIITAGFPCQPWSGAGAKRGTDDDRWLWPDIAKIIRTVGPDYVFLENVRGLMGGGIDLILGDLADFGFDAQWDLFSASDIGAPHKRERLWILAHVDGASLAYPDSGRCETERQLGSGNGEGPLHADRSSGEDVAHPNGERLRGERVSLRGEIGRTETERRSDDVADADNRSGRCRSQLVGDGRSCWQPESERRGFPPRPDDREGWRHWTECGGPQPSIRRGADGPPGRMERLHLLGNGVVPQCAAFAFTSLAGRAGLI